MNFALSHLQEADLDCSWDSNVALEEPDSEEDEEVVFPQWEPIEDWWPAPLVLDEEDGYGTGEDDGEALAVPPPALTWEEEEDEDEDEEEQQAGLIRQLRMLLCQGQEDASVGADILKSVKDVCDRARMERRRREQAEEDARQCQENLRKAMEKIEDLEYALDFNQRQVNQQKVIVACLFESVFVCLPGKSTISWARRKSRGTRDWNEVGGGWVEGKTGRTFQVIGGRLCKEVVKRETGRRWEGVRAQGKKGRKCIK